MIKEFQGEYRWLSNFWPCIIEFDGRTFKSIEHAYMSAKSEDPLWKETCEIVTSPGQIKRMSKGLTLDKDWNARKIEVMKVCIAEKFSDKNPELKSKLLNTDDIFIQEGNTWGDKFWGIDLRSGKGLNHLGKLIMRRREELLNA